MCVFPSDRKEVQVFSLALPRKERGNRTNVCVFARKKNSFSDDIFLFFISPEQSAIVSRKSVFQREKVGSSIWSKCIVFIFVFILISAGVFWRPRGADTFESLIYSTVAICFPVVRPRCEIDWACSKKKSVKFFFFWFHSTLVVKSDLLPVRIITIPPVFFVSLPL